MEKNKIIEIVGAVIITSALIFLCIIACTFISKAKALSDELEHTKEVLSEVQDDCEFAADMLKCNTDKVIGWRGWTINLLEKATEKE